MVVVQSVCGQAIGTWKSYLAYTNTTECAEANNLVYAIADGSMFSYNKTDKEIVYYSKENGLSDNEIGHIGFNEPSSSLASRTRIKTLTQRTRADNARFFASADEVPSHVITMGIGTIMEARTNLLLAFGAKKAQALAEAAEGPVTTMNPASALQLHPDTRVCLDEAAATQLKRADYYRWVFANKPQWQRV